MTGPVLAVTVWDPERSDLRLLDLVVESLSSAGAVLASALEVSEPMVLVSGYPPFGAEDEPVRVRPARPGPGPGGLVRVDVPWWHLDVLAVDAGGRAEALALRAAREAAHAAAVARLVSDVRPLLAVWPVEFPVDTLPKLHPDEAEYLLREGWIDPARVDERRRAALAGVLGGALEEVSGGWRWSGGRTDLGAAVAAVLAGRPVPSIAPYRPVPDIAYAPQLWFWAADRDDGRLLSDVRTWAATEALPADRVWLDDRCAAGWNPVVVDLADDDAMLDEAAVQPVVRAGLALLRRAVARVRPSWLALLPDGGDLVPGAVPDEPATGVLRTVWVSRRWIPSAELAALDDSVSGAHREDVDDGVLVVTDHLVVDDLPGWCRDPDQWWPRAVAQADVLGPVARTSRPDPAD